MKKKNYILISLITNIIFKVVALFFMIFKNDRTVFISIITSLFHEIYAFLIVFRVGFMFYPLMILFLLADSYIFVYLNKKEELSKWSILFLALGIIVSFACMITLIFYGSAFLKIR